jgi:hypothetical protein
MLAVASCPFRMERQKSNPRKLAVFHYKHSDAMAASANDIIMIDRPDVDVPVPLINKEQRKRAN